ncbi:family 10 glycosylhydrolase [Balneola sp. MJW-20]|uniref:family 10 glycosylhydrolase n=1 Tax=Gracilimonas aurantiaca TaxID=3234185 RepID=UPI003466457F
MRYTITLILTTLFLISCSDDQPLNKREFSFAAWTGGGIAQSETEWDSLLSRLSDSGISALYVSGGREKLEEVVAYARPYNIDIHAWIWTLNRPGDTTAAKHPDWYAVNRNGENSYDYRAYVDYYQWLSPFSEGAREHIKNNIREVAQAEGVKSVHLDYVRYVDVILGADLQPKYDIVQDRQYPEYDYGYHPEARRQYEEIFGVDPMDMEHPELSTEWLQFRLNAVTSLVNELGEIARENNKILTAAVFPFPEMSRQMVRQDWSNWELDIALPMLYQNFYRQNLNWIRFATEQGVREADGKFHIIAGLYLPGLRDDQLETAILNAKEGGAVGVSLFNVGAMTEEDYQTVKKLYKEFN